MNCYRERSPSRCCYFHKTEVVVGICSLCLKQKLLILASSSDHGKLPANTHPNKKKKKSSAATNNIPKVFALASSFLQRPNLWHRKTDDIDEESNLSLEDCFISIKFKDDGHASWDKTRKKTKKRKNVVNHRKPSDISQSSSRRQRFPWECSGESRSVVEHAKPHGGRLRWRKRVGHLFQVIWWRKSGKAAASSSHAVGEVEAAAKGKGWIRSLSWKRKTTTE